MLQGHVAELVPGESVTLVLLSGETRKISWDEIASSRGPTFPEPPAPPDPNLQPGPGRVPLVVESTGAPLTVGKSCQTPCTLYVQPGAFLLSTQGVPNTPLEVPVNGMRVRLRPGSPGAAMAGSLLMWPGIGLTAGGIAVAIIGASQSQAATSQLAHGTTTEPSSTLPAVGYALLGIGAAALTASIVLQVASRGRVVERRPGSSVRAGLAPMRSGAVAVLTATF